MLRDENQQLKDRVAWFERQVFGSKSERRVMDNPHQPSLLTEPTETPAEPEPTVKVPGYERGKAKKNRPDDCTTDSGLRFSDEVPVETIRVVSEELKGPQADDYEVIGTQITHKLAQQTASYVVLRYETLVFNR